MILNCGGTVIIGNQVQILNASVCTLLYTNILEKDMNPSVLLPVIDK